MEPWEGRRTIAVISACMTADGLSKLTLTEIAVSQEEYENGGHYHGVEQQLLAQGYEEPFVHFAGEEATPFLIAAVKQSLADAWRVPEPVTEEGGLNGPDH